MIESQNASEKDTYWKSLAQLEGSDAFNEKVQQEFLSSPWKEEADGGFARREFLKLMGASMALATAACVRRPGQSIIPYAKAPVELTPGEPSYYTSTWSEGGEGYGILVKTLDGRPIKLEGNPEHPINAGGLSARAHAEVLSLYDPDRLKKPVRNLFNKERTNRETVEVAWEDLDAKVVETLAQGKVAVLTKTLASVGSETILQDFARATGANVVTFDPHAQGEALREGQRLSYGQAVTPRYRFDKAEMIVSIDCDFLGTYLSPAEFSKQWAKVRTPGKGMAKLISFESNLSLTGMNADQRFRIRPSQQLDVVLGLIASLAKQGAGVGAGWISQYADVTKLGLNQEKFDQVAKDLWARRRKTLVIAGGEVSATPEANLVQVAVNWLNSTLGGDGETIDYSVSTSQTQKGSSKDVAKLIADLNSGAVKTLIIHGLNPVYDLPADMGFAEAIKKADLVVSTSNFNDETSRWAHFVATAGSDLESWGDHEFQSGVYSLRQPTITPLFSTRSFEESLLAWVKKGKAPSARAAKSETYLDYLKDVWQTSVYPKARGFGTFGDFWYQALQKGVIDTSGDRGRSSGARTVSGSALGLLSARKAAPASEFELALYSSVQIGTSRYSNVAWLHELPDPVTKIVWDNYLNVSPKIAHEKGLKDGQMVEVKIGDKSIQAPLHIQPGMHDNVVSLALGYGRTHAGKVCSNIGVAANTMATFADGKVVYSALPVELKLTGATYKLVSTQEHHSMEGRDIIRERDLASYTANPKGEAGPHHVFSMWPQHQYNKHKWGMSIDLNTCTGCSACVIACQSENNVPVVGKRYVGEGREMHWIRIDRYYKGTQEDPQAVFMPLVCQQCENAPCETVCPVLATVHNEEGLNDMVYNRCVGTRYCSNNCPYKVRRFNWFTYNYARPEPQNLAFNPDVTVRSRGVMEKCTFCVQRIRHGTNAARDRKEKLKDGEIKTACEQSCPTNAIVFGDLNDPESRIAQIFKSEPRAYSLLEEVNTAPRVRYLTRIRNGAASHADSKEGGHA